MAVAPSVVEARSSHKAAQPENATAVMDGSSTASAVQNRPPSRETCRRSAVANATRSGCSGEIATATPGPSPAPASRHVTPPSFETTSGGRRSTTGYDRRAVRRGRDDEREIDVGRVRDDLVVDELGVLLLVDVHRDGAEGARDEQPRHRTVMSSTTTCAARAAAATGSRPLTRPST